MHCVYVFQEHTSILLFHYLLSVCLWLIVLPIHWLIARVMKAFKLLLPLYMHCYSWIRPGVKSFPKVTPLELLFVR